ncbi:MAG: hypothetical protein BWX88_01197 [Planctomycetes bacterium ADurb.Bin126]|nr:MAG: hypothetical protein BWX88_01197 [Planctomycetes bacterium ADurb.Bin126]HOD80758.1 DUF6288 domain-containing protein [Phycisphaerae bacterium]HQL71752.1 DUF6288 domain-containing protein [Phycisphaerae bacterium]
MIRTPAQNRFVIAILLLAIAPVVLRANTLPAGKDTKEFMIGVTGIHAALTGGTLKVTQVTVGAPAAGRIEKDDVLEAADGASLQVPDPRHALGFAINAAEGRDGKMTFSIRRGQAKRTVVIQLDPIGRYSPTYPANCKKSRLIVDQTAAFILKHGGPGGGITGNLEGLFLLSTGEAKYLPAVEKYALKLASANAGNSVWMIGYSGIFLGEYYLATGDKRVLPALQARCDALAAGQYYGGWGHGTNNCVVGYVTGGLVNAAGAQGLTTLVLARECGVKVSQRTYDDALRLFFRFAGRGGVPYGDHLPELWTSSNGKNGGLASALTLLPDRKFQAAAQLLALSETDSYFDSETGHGSTFGNIAWRNIVDALVPPEHSASYRRHKDNLIWYFELSRMPGGGFRTPWYPGYGPIGQAPQYQTGLIAMAYTAHLKNLRICGKARTRFSVPHQPTAVEQALPTDDFHRTGFVDGAVITDQPHEIAAAFAHGGNPAINSDRNKKMPVEWYAKIMRHYSPSVRVWAAHGLGFQGQAAIGEITKALASADGRLRVAGLDAISCTIGWSVGKTVSKITPEMIKAHFLPQICKPLKDPLAPMWEKRHALMAMSCCDTQTIAANVKLILPYLGEQEWWLRTAAFEALEPLIDDTVTFRSVLPAMLASYHADTNLPSRRWGATSLFKKAIAKNPALKDEIVAGMAASVQRTEVRPGFKQPIDLNNIYETLRYVNLQKAPENIIPLLGAIERIVPDLNDTMACWTIVGERWGNVGMAKAAQKLGNKAKPIVASMKRIQPNLEARLKNLRKGDKKAAEIQKALDTLREAVEAYEAKFGKA